MDKTKQLKFQLKNMAIALAEKEAEAQRLKKELHRHRGSKTGTNDKRALYPEIENSLQKTKEELASSRKLSQIQKDKITRLTMEVQQKAEEIESLREERDKQLRTIIGYEIDLETHNLHYTNYMDERLRLEQDVMKEVEEKTEGIAALEKKYGCRTQQLISKLITDYADLEHRYKQDRTEFTNRLHILEAETKDLKASLKIMESRLAGSGFNLSLQPSPNMIIQRVNYLEESNVKLRDSQVELKARLTLLEAEQGKLSTAKEHLTIHLTEPRLELELNGLPKHAKELRRFITKLKSENVHKDKRITALRSEAVCFHMQNPPLSWDPASSKGSNAEDEASKSDMPLAFQQQLQDMQQILVRKEQELLNERKRFELREATLSARLEEASPEPHVEAGQVGFFI